MRWWIAIIATITIGSGSAVGGAEDMQPSKCGINAAYSVMLHLGVYVPLDKVYAGIAVNDAGEVNLYELARFARAQGLYVKALRCPTVDIVKKELKIDGGIILQFAYNAHGGEVRHIAALLRSESNEMLYVDVPLAKMPIGDEELKALTDRSKGMLVLSRTPFSDTGYVVMLSSQGFMHVLGAVGLLIMIASGRVLWRNRTRGTR